MCILRVQNRQIGKNKKGNFHLHFCLNNESKDAFTMHVSGT